MLQRKGLTEAMAPREWVARVSLVGRELVSYTGSHRTHKPGMVVHVCHPSIYEVEAGEPGGQDDPHA